MLQKDNTTHLIQKELLVDCSIDSKIGAMRSFHFLVNILVTNVSNFEREYNSLQIKSHFVTTKNDSIFKC